MIYGKTGKAGKTARPSKAEEPVQAVQAGRDDIEVVVMLPRRMVRRLRAQSELLGGRGLRRALEAAARDYLEKVAIPS